MWRNESIRPQGSGPGLRFRLRFRLRLVLFFLESVELTEREAALEHLPPAVPGDEGREEDFRLITDYSGHMCLCIYSLDMHNITQVTIKHSYYY